MPYIGLDIGTLGCKASIVDNKGATSGYAYRTYSTVSEKPGYIEIDARIILKAVFEVLHEVARNDITAIAIASIGEAIVPLGENDEVLSSSIYFSDIRGTEEVDTIKHAMNPEKISAITGMYPNPMFSANKILWLKKHEPDLLNATKYTMLFGDYIAFVLTGERVIDYSLASRTMLFDIHRMKWSEEVADALDLSIDGFSKPVQAGTIIGSMKQSIASELGFSKSVLIVAGGHDQAVTALGGGATSPGEAVDGIGSSECLTVVLDRDKSNPIMSKYGFCCEPHVVEGKYITLSFNASACIALEWYVNIFEKDRLKSLPDDYENVYEWLDSEVSEEPTNILFLPYIAGSGTPWFDSTTGGAFIGLRQGQEKSAIYKSVLEGISYEIKYNTMLLEKCGLYADKIIAAGGGARSDVLMQIKADIMNTKIDVTDNWAIGTIGLGLLCAKAMGDIDDIEKAARDSVHIVKTYKPDSDRAQFYSQKLKEYRSIYTSIKALAAMPSSRRNSGTWDKRL